MASVTVTLSVICFMTAACLKLYCHRIDFCDSWQKIHSVITVKDIEIMNCGRKYALQWYHAARESPGKSEFEYQEILEEKLWDLSFPPRGPRGWREPPRSKACRRTAFQNLKGRSVPSAGE